jgi:hypothetical protein
VASDEVADIHVESQPVRNERTCLLPFNNIKVDAKKLSGGKFHYRRFMWPRESSLLW